ncbi:MAG: carboxypeptidase regulatory-like domain-containing protein [Bryobacteraceae bacterium]|nr:carboxypeptidase regulatory-like domain-containing protein [Bryobacteraceae bacterium]
MLRTSALSALIIVSAAGQTRSSITGVITDQTRAVIPGASVIVTAVETGVEYKTTTNIEGYYTVSSLQAFSYTVRAQFAGLAEAASAPFKLDSSATARVDLVLVAAGSKQVVEVSAAAPAINTESGMIGTTVSAREISDLPVQGRNALSLVTTVAGVGGEMATDEMTQSMRPMAPGAGVSIGGGRLSSTAYTVDGSATTGVAYGRATVTLSTDTVQELKIITNNYSAQYGSVGSGVVSMVTKSGTDQLHGSAFWTQRNPALGARAFNSVSPPRARRNELGATLGGPVWIPKVYNGRNRTFFFASIEPKRYSSENDFRAWVPTAAERAGDLRERYVNPGAVRPLIYQQVNCVMSGSSCGQLLPINRPASTTIHSLFSANDPDPTKRGRVVPPQFIDKTSQLILSYVPLPNIPYDIQGRNFLGIEGNDGRDNRWNVKIDHSVTDHHRISTRYTDIPIFGNNFQFHRQVEPVVYPSHISKTKQPALTHTWVVSPSVVNELRLSYTFGNYSVVGSYDIQERDYTKEIFNLPSSANWGHPAFTIQGTPSANYGMRDGENIGQTREHQYQLADDLTLTRGKHTLMVGVDMRHMQLNLLGNGLQRIAGGAYLFGTNATQAGNANAPGGVGGDSLASFLLGIPTSLRIRDAVVPYYYRWKSYGAYLQDDYKIRRNLTLNLGLRWQYNSPRAEKYNRQATVDLDNPVPLTDAQGRTNGYTFNYLHSGFGRSNYLEPVHKNGWEPRFGFAYTPDFGWNQGRRVVIRGGYGISHLPQTGRSRFATPDFGADINSHSYTQWTGTGAYPQALAVNPSQPVRMSTNPPTVPSNPLLQQIPSDGKLCAGCPPVDPRVPGGSLISFNQDNQLPYLQSWNLTVQKELLNNLVLTVSYLGSKGTHLFSPGLNANQPNQELLNDLLDEGGDPLATTPDPFGRVDAAGNLRLVSFQDLLRPFPTVGDIVVTGMTSSNSIFHAGTFELERRYAAGLGARFNYTWSKSIDNTSDSNFDGTSFGSFGSSKWQDALDNKGNRSVSIYDVRHRFNLTTNYTLPFGESQRFLGGAGRFANAIIGGWQANIIGGLQSGYPLQPALGDRNGLPAQPTGGVVNERMRPNVISGVPIINPLWNKSVANDVPYFNPAAFSRPEYGRKGNAARTLDYARAPWRQSLNGSMMKSFYPFENRSRYVQFRAEFYNLLNHAVFSPDLSANLFTGTPPVSKAGLSLAGPIPYYPTATGTFPVGSREEVLGRNYNPSWGFVNQGSNGAGRVIQFAIRLAW